MRISRKRCHKDILLKSFLAVFCLTALGRAECATGAETGYDDLDNVAIMVKSPAMSSLVAITRTGPLLVAVGLHGVIITSADSGRTWRQAEVPTDVTLTSVVFDSSRHGYAVGHFGVILTTADAGSSWNRAVDGLDVIAALNDTSRQAQSSSPAAPDSQLKLRVANAYQASGPSKPFLAAGRCGNGILAAGQQDMAMFSADNGRTWREWTSAISNPTFRNIYAILDDNAATFVLGEDGLVLKSTMNCENFVPVAGPYSATLFGGILQGEDDIVLYGIDGGVYASKDAGTSWRQISLGIDSVISAGLALSSGKTLLGSLDGNLYLSDADQSGFHELSTAIPFQIAGMVIAPDGSLAVVGNGGVDIVPISDIQ